ncbi:BirA family transcriptional regulator, biotin operon repressor [Candidatus Electronema halotolerans]
MIHHFEVLDSTSSHALALARQGAVQGTVVLADQQTGGRGRAGRQFCSPLGGLYFSVILRPALDPVDFPLLTLAAGVGLAAGLRQAADVQVLLKWPNDLYLAERKLGGILSESGLLQGGLPAFVVVGVGINVSARPEDVPLELRSKVISLAEAGVQSSPAALLLPSLLEELLATVQQLENSGKAALLAAWRRLDYLFGRPLEYDSGEKLLPASGAGLAEDGRYRIVDCSGREHRVMAGDVNPIRTRKG